MTTRNLDALLADIESLENEVDMPVRRELAPVASPPPAPRRTRRAPRRREETPPPAPSRIRRVSLTESTLKRVVRLVLIIGERRLTVGGCVGLLEDDTEVIIDLPTQTFSKTRYKADLVRMCKAHRVWGKRLGLFDEGTIVLMEPADTSLTRSPDPVVEAPAPDVRRCTRCNAAMTEADGEFDTCMSCALSEEPEPTEEVVPIPDVAPLPEPPARRTRRGRRSEPAPVTFTPNPEVDIDELVDAQLGGGPVDDYSVDRFPRCNECGERWHSTPTEDCPGSVVEWQITEFDRDCYTVEFVFEVEPDCAASPLEAARLARQLFRSGAVTAMVTKPDGEQIEVNLR